MALPGGANSDIRVCMDRPVLYIDFTNVYVLHLFISANFMDDKYHFLAFLTCVNP